MSKLAQLGPNNNSKRPSCLETEDLSHDYCKQLKDGMLYHLAFFLRRYQLVGRVSNLQLELLTFLPDAWRTQPHFHPWSLLVRKA